MRNILLLLFYKKYILHIFSSFTNIYRYNTLTKYVYINNCIKNDDIFYTTAVNN